MEFDRSAVEATQDECILGALAHASVILPFWGLIGAIVIWATQREESRFVAFQALQGMVYQLVLVLGSFLCFACYICSFFGTFLLIPVGIFAAEGADVPGAVGGAVGGMVAALTAFSPFCVMGLLAIVWFAYVLYGLYGALQVLQGHDFRYAVIGRRLEDYLRREESARPEGSARREGSAA